MNITNFILLYLIAANPKVKRIIKNKIKQEHLWKL